VNELALFAGSGGGILGGHLLGWRTIAAVEIEDYPRRVLLQRQADGLLPRFPIWDDICTFDGNPWRGKVDVISGGFPCQDISAAGKGDGLDGERSGLWTEMARLVGEIRPLFVFVENSPMLTSRGGVRVIADLTSLGYDTRWTVMGAADIGAPHQRDRIWIVGKVGDTSGVRRQVDSKSISTKNENSQQNCRGSGTFNASENECSWTLANPSSFGSKARFTDTQGGQERDTNKSQHSGSGQPLANPTHSGDVWREWELGFTQQEYNSGGSPTDGSREWWSVEPSVGRVAHGVAHRVDRLKAIGNGQVPLCAASAWRLLTKDWELML
jgi:DNA (cytosine-5)-methyltransferase 1